MDSGKSFCLGMLACTLGLLWYPVTDVDPPLLPDLDDFQRRIRAVPNWVSSIALCLLLIACAGQPATAPTALPAAESPQPTATTQPARDPTATPTAESLAPRPNAQPTRAPASALTPTTATSSPENRTKRITTRLQKQIDAAAQDSSCYVGRTFEGTISYLSTKSIIHLRAFFKVPDLAESEVHAIVDYLEHQRGRHARLCQKERGNTVPVKELSAIMTHYNEGLARMNDKGQNCEASELAEKLSFSFLYENINYIRGYFDAPTLSRDDLLQMITHLESESGRLAALCAR